MLDALCVEMDAARLMNDIPSLVVLVLLHR